MTNNWSVLHNYVDCEHFGWPVDDDIQTINPKCVQLIIICFDMIFINLICDTEMRENDKIKRRKREFNPSKATKKGIMKK